MKNKKNYINNSPSGFVDEIALKYIKIYITKNINMTYFSSHTHGNRDFELMCKLILLLMKGQLVYFKAIILIENFSKNDFETFQKISVVLSKLHYKKSDREFLEFIDTFKINILEIEEEIFSYFRILYLAEKSISNNLVVSQGKDIAEEF